MVLDPLARIDQNRWKPVRFRSSLESLEWRLNIMAITKPSTLHQNFTI